MPGTGQAEWRGLLKFKQPPHVINPQAGLAGELEQPAVGGLDQRRRRGEGAQRRPPAPRELPARARRETRPGTRASTPSRRSTARAARSPSSARCTTAQLRKADTGASGRRSRCSTRSSPGTATTTASTRTNTVDPGLAAWNALKAALVKRELPAAARSWLGAPGASHQHDAGGAAGAALLEAGPGDLRKAAGEAAAALTKRFGNADPASWRDPRPMYDVGITGIADQAAAEVLRPRHLAAGGRARPVGRAGARRAPSPGRAGVDAPAAGEGGELGGERPAVRLRLALVVGRGALERHRAGVVADRADLGDLVGATARPRPAARRARRACPRPAARPGPPPGSASARRSATAAWARFHWQASCSSVSPWRSAIGRMRLDPLAPALDPARGPEARGGRRFGNSWPGQHVVVEQPAVVDDARDQLARRGARRRRARARPATARAG